MPITAKYSHLIAGVMSGTSVDGIDVAVGEIGKNGDFKLKHYQQHLMPEELREPILRLAEPGVNEIDPMGELDRALGKAISEAVLKTLKKKGIRPDEIIAIGSHGQTIRHRPQEKHPFSLQIGCPSTITECTGITTVADFRRRDIAAGGEGAPLTPFIHQILFGEQDNNVAVLNIGGIANVTLIPANGQVLGFDTGPGNMIMDNLILTLSDGRYAYDRNGELAASGNICKQLLEELLDHPYFKRKPPKSTGREDFGRVIVDIILGWQGISDADRMATATELTARTIAESHNFLTAKPESWYACGGGASNTYLMNRLESLLTPAKVFGTDRKGIPTDAVEAVCFAILAWHTLLGKSNTLPEVTGARHAVTTGHIVPGDNWPELLQTLARIIPESPETPSWTHSPMP